MIDSASPGSELLEVRNLTVRFPTADGVVIRSDVPDAIVHDAAASLLRPADAAA